MNETLVMMVIPMGSQLTEQQKQDVQMAMEESLMSIEEAGAPAMSPSIIIGDQVIKPRG